MPPPSLVNGDDNLLYAFFAAKICKGHISPEISVVGNLGLAIADGYETDDPETMRPAAGLQFLDPRRLLPDTENENPSLEGFNIGNMQKHPADQHDAGDTDHEGDGECASPDNQIRINIKYQRESCPSPLKLGHYF